MLNKVKHNAYHVIQNLFLLTLGTSILALGLKAIAIPHGFITGGVSGLSWLLYYVIGVMTPGIWYFVLNLPLFVSGWIFLSRRFFLYSLYGMITMTLAIDFIPLTIAIQDKLLAALAGGTLIAAGAGIYLHSLGSAGGSDIITIILNQKYNIRIGGFFFYFRHDACPDPAAVDLGKDKDRGAIIDWLLFIAKIGQGSCADHFSLFQGNKNMLSFRQLY